MRMLGLCRVESTCILCLLPPQGRFGLRVQRGVAPAVSAGATGPDLQFADSWARYSAAYCSAISAQLC
jgi:hypothetical protein